MGDVAISIQNVSKFYKLYKNGADRLKEALHPFGRIYHHDFYAIHDLSLEVKRGEVLGIVGRNGCGKSTLLKLMAQVLKPSSGEIKIYGKVTALLELGAGFNPEFTGRQNIRFYAAVLGLEAKEIEVLTPHIIAFAELGEFIDQPVKTYSSGMKARLAFATASQLDSEILILDEVLAVGDELFVKKCYEVIRGFIRRDKTILLVSHSAQAIADFCTRAVLINQGRVVYEGKPADTIKEYRKLLYGGQQISYKPTGSAEIDIERYDPGLECPPTMDIDCQVLALERFDLSVDGRKANIVKYDDKIAIELTLKERVPVDWDGLHAGMTIVTKTGLRLASLKFTSTSHLDDRVVLKTQFKCPLNEGLYSVIFSVVGKDDLDYKLFVHDIFVFKVVRDDRNHFDRWAQIEIKGQ